MGSVLDWKYTSSWVAPLKHMIGMQYAVIKLFNQALSFQLCILHFKFIYVSVY